MLSCCPKFCYRVCDIKKCSNSCEASFEDQLVPETWSKTVMSLVCVAALQCRLPLCMFVHLLKSCISVWICMLHVLSPLAFIIFGARPWAEVRGDPPTLVQHVCATCVSMYCSSLSWSLALRSLMTQQGALMAKNTHSLLLCGPQLISWSVRLWTYCKPSHNRNQCSNAWAATSQYHFTALASSEENALQSDLLRMDRVNR